METNPRKPKTFSTGPVRLLGKFSTSEAEIPEEKRRVLEVAAARLVRQRRHS